MILLQPGFFFARFDRNSFPKKWWNSFPKWWNSFPKTGKPIFLAIFTCFHLLNVINCVKKSQKFIHNYCFHKFSLAKILKFQQKVKNSVPNVKFPIKNVKTHFQKSKTHFQKAETHFHRILLEWTRVEFGQKKSLSNWTCNTGLLVLNPHYY